MKELLEVTKTNRKIIEKKLESLSLEELNTIPEGFNNNIFWNIAHTVVTQQLLVYKLSGLPMQLEDAYVEKYRKGTKTEDTATAEDVALVKSLLHSTIEQTEKDLEMGLFKEYTEYPTSTGFVLKNLKDAISFNNFHEGIHLGYILGLIKAL